MKNLKLLFSIPIIISIMVIPAFIFKAPVKVDESNTKKGCVFRTVFGEDPADTTFIFKTPTKVLTSMERGLEWVAKAQQQNGGWGAGSHSMQNVMDPHAVKTDPATTSMVCMALLRSGNTLNNGKYSTHLKKGMLYLLVQTETADPNSTTITKETGTQIQTKLGANIDVIMTSQFFSNVMDYLEHDPAMKKRVKNALNICVIKIQKSQSADGSFAGAGWAGVLQSSFASNALEAAQLKGIKVDTVVLEKSKNYQKGNYNAATGEVNTDRGAGVVLYSVSSSTRAAAKDRAEVDDIIRRAKKEGKWNDGDEVNAENLQKAGLDKNKAMKASTAYNVYESAKLQAQDKSVLQGFGNNGGEEFLSFLQTGESLAIARDNGWKNWYDNTSSTLMGIQNQDGSWNGHHCITSPVFCTATCVLVLSINNDIDKFSEVGGM
jgi:hypothetical protein